jgi:hypothetical protein
VVLSFKRIGYCYNAQLSGIVAAEGCMLHEKCGAQKGEDSFQTVRITFKRGYEIVWNNCRMQVSPLSFFTDKPLIFLKIGI